MGWLLDFAFPAQRYLRRSSEQRRHEMVQRLGLSEPPPRVPPDFGATAFGWAEPGSERWRALRGERLAARDRILADQEDLLHSTVATLERTRTAEIRTAAGTISARIASFRWGPDVLEVTRTGPHGRRGFGTGLLTRHHGADRTRELMTTLAYHLAVLGEGNTPPVG